MKNTIYSYFSHRVELHPDAPACLDERRSLSYRRLDQLSDTLASRFPGLKSRRIGLVMDHTVEMAAAILAIVKSGGAYVPVEPSFPDDRIRFVMTECDVDFIITNSQYAGRFSFRPTLTVDPGAAIDPTAHTADRSEPGDPAYILYTSGSTGLPKGVIVSNSNVCHYVRAFRREFHPGPGDVMMQHSVCSFDIFVEELFSTLLSGATLAMPSAEVKKDIGLLMEFVKEHGVTIISGFPYLLKDLDKLPALPSSLRLLISGGDVLRESYVANLLPRIEIYNTYGPSETTVCATYFRCNGAEALPDGTYPIGHPVEGVSIEIRDPKMRPVPAGKPGEICIFGDGVSMGYIGDRKTENEAFVTLDDGRRMYRSGDLGTMMPDGTLLFHHRLDSQVMILGRRVETCEVENVLCQCPEIESGVVKAATDDKGLSFLVAYFVPKRLKRFSLRHLKERMMRFLPDYMVPEFFVKLQAIPLTPNGKINSSRLPRIAKHNPL